MISLSGKTLDDNIIMLRRILIDDNNDSIRYKIAAVEINLACPNIVGKPTLAYDIDQLQYVLQQIKKEFEPLYQKEMEKEKEITLNNDQKSTTDSTTTTTTNIIKRLPKLGIKLPPYLDLQQMKQVATIINENSSCVISFVTTINTMGNALPINVNARQPYCMANDGYMGMSGKSVHATACANVRTFRKYLYENIDIVGVGGVQSGKDVIALILAGAKAVQIGTTHWIEGPSCFDRIAQETKEWLYEHDYSNISQIYNQLQPYSKERANEERKKRKKEEQEKENTTTAVNTSLSLLHHNQYIIVWQIIVALLVIVIAILLADKYKIS